MSVADRFRRSRVVIGGQDLSSCFANAPVLDISAVGVIFNQLVEEHPKPLLTDLCPGCLAPWPKLLSFCLSDDREHDLLTLTEEITSDRVSNPQDPVTKRLLASNFEKIFYYLCLADDNKTGDWSLFGGGFVGTNRFGLSAEPTYGTNLPLSPEQREEANKMVAHHITRLLYAFAFVNCKNVTLQKVGPSRQVRKRAERHGDPIFEHHRIVIDKMLPVLRSIGKLDEHHSLAKAFHLCRGHFVRYGEEYGTGKLFGKYEGQFWKPQHVRGSLQSGLITKDYIAKAGQEGGTCA